MSYASMIHVLPGQSASDWPAVMGIRPIPDCNAAGSRKAVWWVFYRG